MRHARMLFILKHRDNHYTGEPYSYGGLSSGLLNSARFVVEMLNENGVKAWLEQVVNNNEIDRAIVKHKATHVIIEAFWVVPEKFDVLKRLHPKVTFIVRNHSEAAFLAQEGNAIAWTLGYLQRGVKVAPNSKAMFSDTQTISRAAFGNADNVMWLPNTYKLSHLPRHVKTNRCSVDVGCFGAIRPLKNQLTQAIAALKFARKKGLKLRFHINATRIEHGNNVLNNIRALFAGMPSDYTLIEHPWLSHRDFLRLLAHIDISLCVSFSETFCIVAADSVNMHVPIVASPEVTWLSPTSWAEPTDVDDIVSAMETAHKLAAHGRLVTKNMLNLEDTIAQANKRWLSTFAR